MKPIRVQSPRLSQFTQRKICEVAQDDPWLTTAELAHRFGCTKRQAQMAMRRNGISPQERWRNRPRLDARGSRRREQERRQARASR